MAERELAAEQHARIDPPSCDFLVYRALRNKACIDQDTGRVAVDAFLRRSCDDDGLSVGCSPETAVRDLKKSYGVASLHVGRIRDLGLEVVLDSVDHGVIVGIPADDKTKSEALAGDLARMSRWVLQVR